MNRCPECSYLVPAAWNECRRCGASLERADAVRPASAPSSTAIPRRRSSVQPANPTRVPPSPIDSRYTPPSRTDPATDGPTGRRRRRLRLPVVGPICIMVVIASMWMGYQRFTHPPIPAVLRPWVQDNQGVLYRPVGTPLSVSLPTVPVESSERITFGPNLEGGARVAIARAGDHEVGVVWMVAPTRAFHTTNQSIAADGAEFAGRAAGFRVLVPTETEHEGRPALDAVIERDGHDGRAFVVVDGTSVYAVFTSAEADPDAGFDFLVDSFSLGPIN